MNSRPWVHVISVEDVSVSRLASLKSRVRTSKATQSGIEQFITGLPLWPKQGCRPQDPIPNVRVA